MKRPDGRKAAQLRPLSCTWDPAANALASVLLRCGGTHVLCAVSCEESVPKWREQQGVPGGWVTAEYSMLPYSTHARKPRDITKGKIDGRSQEIQRLIGRSLRAVVDLEKLGPRSLWVDCDVLAADGGTRTTAITGSYLALRAAVMRLRTQGSLKSSPLLAPLAAISVGIWQKQPVLDLCYVEDRDASVDMNVVMTGSGEFVELQASGEEATFSGRDLDRLLIFARTGLRRLFAFQRSALKTLPPSV